MSKIPSKKLSRKNSKIILEIIFENFFSKKFKKNFQKNKIENNFLKIDFWILEGKKIQKFLKIFSGMFGQVWDEDDEPEPAYCIY